MIRKCVIPAAGFGSRFLPATKVQPKEMMPIIDTPTIQLVVEEAVHAGLDDILVVTGRGKQAIETHFDRTFELESDLAARGKLAQLRLVRELSEMAHIHFIRQQELKGLGDALRYARWHVGSEPFVVLLGDTICRAEVPCTRQLIDVYNLVGASVIAVEEVAEDRVGYYGNVIGEEVEPGLFRITKLLEKPHPADTESRLAVAGRYVFTPAIFDAIDQIRPDARGEYQLVDAVRWMMANETVYAYRFCGQRYSVGDRLDYLKTVVAFAIDRPDIGLEFRDFLAATVADFEETSVDEDPAD